MYEQGKAMALIYDELEDNYGFGSSAVDRMLETYLDAKGEKLRIKLKEKGMDAEQIESIISDNIYRRQK